MVQGLVVVVVRRGREVMIAFEKGISFVEKV